MSEIRHEIRQARSPRLRDLLLYANRRLEEERLPQVAGSLTFTTVLALVPVKYEFTPSVARTFEVSSPKVKV